MSRVRPKTFVIGARGFLGRHIVRAMASSFEVIKGVRKPVEEVDEIEIDITQQSSVDHAFEQVRPKIVLLLAAISDIDQCEQNPEEATAVNVRGAEHVVNACRRANARLLYTSTGAVFDGKKHGYTEEDMLSPISVYGKTKAQAEAKVLELGSSAIIVRIALAIGFAGENDADAVLDKMAKRLKAGETVELPTFEQRNPIDAVTLSHFFTELLLQPTTHGIFHAGAREPVSRYELGRKLAARMGYPNLVQPQQQPIKDRAPRGPDHYLLPNKLAGICSTPIPTCDQVIERCFDGVA
ncbi:MAG TPA: NAD(P)-dependent oxidoreductase [Candidatus Aquilonibacter sp.]|jgi:dTDP-4-dehydrorhamnose reductase|nr:NAD(P)-dependent oxidoreductase [Candidatus Aquilonibacter sp.]